MAEQIQVVGLKELNRALKQLDVELPKELKGKVRAIAERVAALVRGKLPRLTGNMINNTRARATQRGAAIAWSGKASLYAGPVEFGGWPKGRPFVKKGRYVFPTVEAERSRIEEELIGALNDVITRAGLD